MASSFLERKAKEREEVINRQYNKTPNPKIVNNTSNQKAREKASSFLQRKADNRNQVLANNSVTSIPTGQIENSYINHLKKNSLLSSSGIYMDGLRSIAPQDSAMNNQQSEYERLSTYDVNAGKSQLEMLKSQLNASRRKLSNCS